MISERRDARREHRRVREAISRERCVRLKKKKKTQSHSYRSWSPSSDKIVGTLRHKLHHTSEDKPDQMLTASYLTQEQWEAALSRDNLDQQASIDQLVRKSVAASRILYYGCRPPSSCKCFFD